MEVGGEFRRHGEQPLAVFALGLTEQLLPPAAEHGEARLEALKQLQLLAVAVHEIPDGGVEPDGIFVGTQII